MSESGRSETLEARLESDELVEFVMQRGGQLAIAAQDFLVG